MKTLKQNFYPHIIPIIFLILVMLIPARALASPYISLQTYDDWNNALGDGRITPVSTYYDALTAHYGHLNFVQVTPHLMALTGAQSGYGDGLLMDWGDLNADPEAYQVATWQYNYPEDPNLIGTVLNFNIMPPPGIQSVSLTINDALGGWISWDWNVTLIGGGGPLFTAVQNLVTINPNIFNAQGASSFAMNPIVGFNPAIATTIQADELAFGANQWNIFPPVPVVGGVKPWNYWGNLNVSAVPEPSALLLISAGLAGLAMFKRIRKRGI